MTQQNTITTRPNGGMSIVGEVAVDTFRIKCLKQAIKCAKSGMVLTRGMTMTRSLKMASEYTGKAYKRGQADQAIADLDALCDARVTSGEITVTHEG